MSQNTIDVAQVTGQFKNIRPVNGFSVIEADNPWEFMARSPKGEGKSAQRHYECLSIDELCKLPVELLAAKDCALFMWVTWPLMPHWNTVLEAWGFTYAGLGWEWIKYNPVTDKYAFGPGYGTRKNLEPCLLATRGNPSVRGSLEFFGNVQIPQGVRSVRDFILWMPDECIRAPRRGHSQKPDEQYENIETLFDGPYVELFSRSSRPGWIAWGNEVGKLDEVAA